MEAEQLTWRRAEAADEPLLFRLFAVNKAAEFAPLGLAAQELDSLLLMQYRARQQSYAQSFPAAVDTILCRGDGAAVGRHLVERQPNCYRGVDLAVLPEHRNRGVGAWALRQIQQAAALEEIPFRLRVVKSNPALRLYERLSFLRAGSDELSFNMEWQPPTMRASRPKPEEKITLPDGAGADRQEVLHRIFGFFREIGLRVDLAPVPLSASVPGVQLVCGGLRVDVEALLYPGDLLHEAGRLAVMTPEGRQAEFPSSDDPAEKMAALSWSYAAVTHIGLPAEVVFHAHGYRGQGQTILRSFQSGHGVGTPLLGWMGLTTVQTPARQSIYPRMLRWLRETGANGVEENTVALEMG